MNICVCITESHFVVHLKLTQHCKSTILQQKKIFFFFKEHVRVYKATF